MNEIIEWLKQYSVTSGIGKFVIGISGGIDSALTSTLCAETGIPTILMCLSPLRIYLQKIWMN